jgi:hypothetical protein
MTAFLAGKGTLQLFCDITKRFERTSGTGNDTAGCLRTANDGGKGDDIGPAAALKTATTKGRPDLLPLP